MRRILGLVVVMVVGLTWAGAAGAANGSNLRTIIADRSGTQCASYNAAGQHGSVGVGIAFDGTNLLISCYSDNTVTAVTTATGAQVAIHGISGAGSLGALAWDNGRGLLWACSNFSQVGTIDLATNVFTFKFNTQGCFDGLAYDGADDTIWTSGDVSSTTQHYSVTGLQLASYGNSGKIGGCGNSGIAVGGAKLYLANNGCSQIYELAKDFSTSSLFATFPARLEDLECDNLTFGGGPNPTGAIWSIDAYDNVLNAWEIPNGACLFGGGKGELAIDPPSAENPVGTSHTVTATLTDRGNPVANGQILWTVTGANSLTGTSTTDANGVATFSYVGANAGLDTITACYDKNGNGTCDQGETTATATKNWIVVDADLGVTKVDDVDPIGIDGLVTYTITVHNYGPANATGVEVTDAFSGPAVFVSGSGPGGACTVDGGGLIHCLVGNLANGADAVVTITLQGTAPGLITDTAHADGDQPEQNPANDAAEETTLVIDDVRPSGSCSPGVNPSGKQIPTAGANPKSGQNPDGFYQLNGFDNIAVASIQVRDSGSAFISGSFANGDYVKITQAPGSKPSDTRPGPGVITSHLKLKGDAILRVTDTAGNVYETACLVPPPPK